MRALTIEIPDIDMVDSNGPIDAESYVGLMIQFGNEQGAFMPGFRPTAEWNSVRKTTMEMTRRFEALFSLMSPARKMMRKMAYDTAWRIHQRKSEAIQERIVQAQPPLLRPDIQ